MTKEFYRTGNYKVDHTTFGGIINSFDFDGHCSMRDIADKIMSDLRFDEQCHKNIESRKRENNYKRGLHNEIRV